MIYYQCAIFVKDLKGCSFLIIRTKFSVSKKFVSANSLIQHLIGTFKMKKDKDLDLAYGVLGGLQETNFIEQGIIWGTV